jgi:hypothetical protein
MPANIANLRAGLATQLQTISGLRVYEYIPGTPNFPCAVIRLNRVGYDSTLSRGSDEIDFVITMAVGRADDRIAQTSIETYLAGTGSLSVKTAIENDPTLGGAALNTRVQEARNIATEDRGDGLSFLTVDFAVTVIA